VKDDFIYLSQGENLPFPLSEGEGMAQLMAVLESSYDGIFLTDGQAVPLWCNHAYELISGLSARDVVGTPMADLVAKGSSPTPPPWRPSGRGGP
jgi:PAS domain-containing protein